MEVQKQDLPDGFCLVLLSNGIWLFQKGEETFSSGVCRINGATWLEQRVDAARLYVSTGVFTKAPTTLGDSLVPGYSDFSPELWGLILPSVTVPSIFFLFVHGEEAVAFHGIIADETSCRLNKVDLIGYQKFSESGEAFRSWTEQFFSEQH